MFSQNTTELNMSFDSSSLRCTTQHIKRTFQDIENGQQEQTVTKYLDSKCPICYEIMISPYQLTPCGHVFCEKCVSKINNHLFKIIDELYLNIKILINKVKL